MKIIAGKYYRRILEVPKNKTTRPTTSRLREALFNILQHEIEGATFLDIFAGSGAIGIEALSRGAVSATFIESDRFALQTLKNNLERLKISREAEVLFGDYHKNLKGLGFRKARFDLIFADAPYQIDVTEQILLQVASNQLLKPYGKLFIENDSSYIETLNLQDVTHINSRKAGKSFLHQFQISPP